VTLSALDISKAFDRISHYALYNRLMSHNVPLCYINVLKSWYSNSYIKVKFNNVLSEPFKMEAGVRQGGITSAVNFAIYIDILIDKLKLSGKGCSINGSYVGCLLYADDIMLISISVSAMQCMLDICYNIAVFLDLKFNVKKSCVMRIGNRHKFTCANLSLGGQYLDYVSSIKYLGVYIVTGKVFSCNYDHVKLKFYRTFNAIYTKSKASCSELITMNLMKSYCIPVIFYATEAIIPKKPDLEKFDKIINNVIGKIFNTYDMPTIIDIKQFLYINKAEDIVKKRQINFLNRFFNKKFDFSNSLSGCNIDSFRDELFIYDV